MTCPIDNALSLSVCSHIPDYTFKCMRLSWKKELAASCASALSYKKILTTAVLNVVYVDMLVSMSPGQELDPSLFHVSPQAQSHRNTVFQTLTLC